MKPLTLEPLSSFDRIERPPMLIDEIIPEHSVTVVGGAPYTGKTFFALEAGLAVAYGRPFMGRFNVPRCGNVLLIEQDAPRYDTGRALYAMARNISSTWDVSGQTGADPGGAFQVAWHPNLDLTNKEDAARIVVTANALLSHIGQDDHYEDVVYERARLIILDSLRDLSSADENSSTEVRAVMSAIKFIRNHTDAAVLVLHHTRKQRKEQADTLRGSNAIDGAADNIFRLKRTKGSDAITVEIDKARAIQPPSFQYRIVTTADEDGFLVKTVSALQPEISKPKKPESEELAAFQARCAQGYKDMPELLAWGKERGVSRATIYRWKKQLDTPTTRPIN